MNDDGLNLRQWLWTRAMAPAWGLGLGLAALIFYWPGIVGILPGMHGSRRIKTFETIDLRIGDTLHRWFATGPTAAPNRKICVVGLTSEALTRYGPMPWPRTRHADLVRRLHSAEASVIAFDIPDLGQMAKGEMEDQNLAAATRDAGNVILPRCSRTLDPVSGSLPEANEFAGTMLTRKDVGVIRGADGVYRTDLWDGVPLLYRSAAGVSHIKILEDDDLVARRVPAAIGEKGQKTFYLPVGVAAAMLAEGGRAAVNLEPGLLVYDGVRIPLDAESCIIVNYQPFEKMVDMRPYEVRQIESKDGALRSPGGAPISFYSYLDLIEGRVPADGFKKAVVLVGQWGSREDVHLTPQGSQYGVMVQAMLLHTVVTRKFLSVASTGWTVLLMLLLSVVLSTVFFSVRFRASSYVVIVGGALLMLLGVVAVLIVVGLFRRGGLVVDASPFLMVFGLNLVGGIVVNAARASSEADRRNREMDLVLVAGKRHTSELASSDTPRSSVIPGSPAMAMTASLSVRSPDIVAETFWQTIPCDGCVVFVIGQGESLTFERSVYQGFHGKELTRQSVEPMAVRFAWETLKRGRPVVMSRRSPEWHYANAAPALRTLLGVPVIVGKEPLAVVILFNKRATAASPEREFTEDQFRLIAALRYQSAALLENARRYQLEYAMFDGFARSLAKAVDFRDAYTRGHSERVADLSKGIAAELGLTTDEIEVVLRAATLHDLGKIGINDTLLKKPGKLSREEFAAIRAHAANGFEILKAAPSFEALLPGIRHHHERYDGQGYPDGLAGNSIPLLARIIAVADAYDAMTSDRPYRTALLDDRACAELLEGAGTQFDPQIVEAILRHLRKRGGGRPSAVGASDVSMPESAAPAVAAGA